ncbi:MAG: DUF3857 domain-containing transglutaminase family protein [Pedobacter sp.]|nr:DUF3857 domain-containing transglutaminase family protein [Pedobacter sp.]
MIPANLRNRANATIRTEEITVDMQSPTDVTYTVKKAITILNKNGDLNAGLFLFYDKNTVIKSIKGEVYNEFGNLVNKFSQSDFKDESAVQGFSLFEDNRVKHYLPNVNTYPFTVVYQYEIRFKQNLIIPDWRPKPAVDVSVENSKYTFICKPGDMLRIKAQNYNGKAQEQENDKQKVLTWEVKNLPGTKPEPYSPNKDEYLTSIKIAPQQFTYFNYKGNYSNWEELGKWNYDNLLKNRDVLPPSTIQTINELIKDESNDKAKAKKIYTFLQDKTRYISVQVGIGGFQPTTAAEVDRLGYGDCKALVNYMQSLLKVAGIESYYCVVEGGNQKISLDPTYASMNQGNHIILCMPLAGDTTWLECTSQLIPFGYLGDFTDDRYVLACTPTGGKLLKTPKLTTANNLQVRHADLLLARDGQVTGQLQTTFKGSQYNNNEYILGKSNKQQQELLKEVYDIDNINFTQISYRQKKDVAPELIEDLQLEIRNYGAVNGDKIFLLPNAFNVKTNIPETKNRTLPIYINRGFTDLDTIRYQLPANASLINEVGDVHLSNNFGEYFSTVKIDGKQLTYIRKLVINEGTFPAETYATFSNFIAAVNAADRLKLIISLK